MPDRPARRRSVHASPDARLAHRIARRSEVELEIPDGIGGTQRWPVWVVQVGHSMYVRARRGTRREWYRWLIRRRAAILRAGDLRIEARADHVKDRAVIDAVSEAYARKYGTDASVHRMFLPRARRSTLELLISPEEGRSLANVL